MIGVLIVDDDRELVSSLEGEVSRMGYKTYVADSADAAIETMLNNQIEVMVTDLRMGRRDGIDLIKMAKQVSPKTRSILMSAYATARDYKVAVDLGAVDVLPKPFTPADLAQSIKKAIDCEEGFRGTVHGLSLTDILQMFHYARRSLTIQIGAETNVIHLEDGEVTHAVAGAEEGKQALITLLQYRSGSVRTLPPVSCPRTIDVPFRALLLDTMREVDENRRQGADALATQPTDTGSTDERASKQDKRASRPSQPAAVQAEAAQPVGAQPVGAQAEAAKPVGAQADAARPAGARLARRSGATPPEMNLDFDNSMEDDLLSRAAPPPQLMRTESLADVKAMSGQRNRPSAQVSHAEDPARGVRPTGPVALPQAMPTGPVAPGASRPGPVPTGAPVSGGAGVSPPGGGGFAAPETASPADSVVGDRPMSAVAPMPAMQPVGGGRPSRVPLLLGMATGLVALMVISVLVWLLWFQGDDRGASAQAMGGAADPVALADSQQAPEVGRAAEESPDNATAAPAPKQAVQQITVSTKPPGLLLLDANSLKRFGPSPIVLEVKPGEKPPLIKAALGTRLSRPLTVRPDAVRAQFDLRRWAKAARATVKKPGLARRRRPRRARNGRGGASGVEGKPSAAKPGSGGNQRPGGGAAEPDDQPALAPLDEDENAPNLGLID